MLQHSVECVEMRADDIRGSIRVAMLTICNCGEAMMISVDAGVLWIGYFIWNGVEGWGADHGG